MKKVNEECDLGVGFDDIADNHIFLLYQGQMEWLAGWLEILF